MMCYEKNYVYSPWIRADLAIRNARSKNEIITIVGNFRKASTIELDWIVYEGRTIDTDYKPTVHRIPRRW